VAIPENFISRRQPSRFVEYGILLAVLVFGLTLRLWGAFFDLPYIYHPDEPININVIQGILARGDPNPHYFDYPSLFYYLNALVAWLCDGLPAYVSGRQWALVAPISIAMGSTFAVDANAVASYRTLTILAGILSVFLVYLIGKRGEGVRTGLVAAMLMAISPLVVADCRHVTPDSYVVVFELLTILASLAVATSGRWIAYVAAGIAVGATAGTKYNGAVVCTCVIAAHLFRFGIAPKEWVRLGLAGVVSVFAFLLSTPFALFDNHLFMTGMTNQFHHYAGGHQGMEGNAPAWYLSELWAEGGVASVLAVVQLARLRQHRTALMVVLAGCAIPYLLFISFFTVRNDRTLLPIVPSILILAAMYAVYLGSSQSPIRRVSPSLRQILLITLGLAMIVTPLRVCVVQTMQLTTIDSRATAREWINSQLPPHSIVAVESYAPFIDPSRFRIVQTERAIDHPLDWYLDHGVDYVVLSQGMFGRYFGNPHVYPTEVAYYQHLMGSLNLVKRFTDGGYTVFVFQTQPAVAVTQAN